MKDKIIESLKGAVIILTIVSIIVGAYLLLLNGFFYVFCSIFSQRVSCILSIIGSTFIMSFLLNLTIEITINKKEDTDEEQG